MISLNADEFTAGRVYILITYAKYAALFQKRINFTLLGDDADRNYICRKACFIAYII